MIGMVRNCLCVTFNLFMKEKRQAVSTDRSVSWASVGHSQQLLNSN